jgi:hypothetical protein
LVLRGTACTASALLLLLLLLLLLSVPSVLSLLLQLSGVHAYSCALHTHEAKRTLTDALY